MGDDDIGEVPVLPTESTSSSQTTTTQERQADSFYAVFENIPLGNEPPPRANSVENAMPSSKK